MATLLAYFPALRGGMLWDDDGHVTKPFLRSADGLWRIWFDLGATQQYYPLLHTAFWIEHGLWGDAVLGYHLVNVVLHVGAALLLVAIVRRLGLGETAGWVAGALFALHPVSVEAVAWISEQKSTLSAVFYLASALVYLNFDRTRKGSLYAAALLLFVMALLAKSVTATLPAALLLVIWWQRGRLDWKRDALPLLPWFGIGAASGLFTAWVEKTYIGANGSDFALSFLDRLLLAGRVICFYFSKLILPVNLMFFYPHWTVDAGQWWQYLFTLGVLAVLGVFIWLGKRAPLTAALFFIGTLFPVLGFFNVYPFVYSWVADHFAYLASIGVIVPVAVLAAKRLPVAAVLTVILAVLTWQETREYKDVETLYTETLARNPNSWISHNNLGNFLLDKPGRLNEAVGHFKAALQLKPDSGEPHNNLGSAYSRQGRLRDAIAEFQTALKFRPSFPQALSNLGSALSKMPGRNNEAIERLQEAIRLKPDFADAHNNLGNALSGVPGRLPEAIEEYETALRLDPDFADAHGDLGVALEQLGRTNEAIREYQAALQLKPDSSEMHSNLGVALTKIGNFPEAVAELETALRLNPKSADARANLGIAYSKMPGKADEAMAEYQRALQLNPNQPDAQNNIGIVLAQAGRINEAIPHFEIAVRNEPNSVETHMNLGNALLDVPGRLPEAVQQYEAAVKLKPDLFEAHYFLGLALARIPNRANEGLDELEAALKIRPDPETQRLVEQMRRLRH